MRQISKFALATAACLAVTDDAHADVFRFDTDPFAGSTALTTPGRQVVGNELFLPDFSFANDVFSFDPAVFDVDDEVAFFNGLAADLPGSGFNVIVLQDSDDDNNPSTAFNAGSAANLIANGVTQPGAGFFIYFNSALNLNRLVYSTDLDVNTADLKILARIEDPTGQGAIDALPLFTAANFDISVPVPAAFTVFAAGLLGLGTLVRHRRR